MIHPPSLSKGVKARAFRASNGELGIPPDDVAAFLAACRSYEVEVLGWEIWVVDYLWAFDRTSPVPSPGAWCGGIPVNAGDVPAIVGGEGDADEAERPLATLHLSVVIRPKWLPHVRVHFSLGAPRTPEEHLPAAARRGKSIGHE